MFGALPLWLAIPSLSVTDAYFEATSAFTATGKLIYGFNWGSPNVRRGYENIERKFLDLGARIERVQEGGTTPA